MNRKFLHLICGVALLTLFGCSDSEEKPNEPVKNLNLERYLGRWYEVARFDHTFERGLVGCTADYSMNDDGTILVVNSGYKKTLDGKFDQSVGKARRPDPSKPGMLEVSFFMNIYSQYNVLELAEDYRYALVGSKSDRYLWILSRTPQLSQADLDYLVKSAEKRGYNTDKLIWVEQKVE